VCSSDLIDDDPSQGMFRGTRFLHPDLDFTLYFPDGWTPVNTPQAVGALTPRRDARIALELAGDGGDPEAVAHTYLNKRLPEMNATLERGASITISGRPAYEARASVPTPAGMLLAQLTFVPLGGRIYLLSAVAPAPAFGGYRGRAAATLRSLRPLKEEERSGIRVMRLWSIRAEEGESLEEISRRARNELDLQRTAVMNGLFTETRLRKGQLLKVARTEPYRSPEKPAAAPAMAPPGR